MTRIPGLKCQTNDGGDDDDDQLRSTHVEARALRRGHDGDDGDGDVMKQPSPRGTRVVDQQLTRSAMKQTSPRRFTTRRTSVVISEVFVAVVAFRVVISGASIPAAKTFPL